MIFFLYVEEGVADHPRTEAVRERLGNVVEIPCERYGEIFNPRAQSFRLQKRRAALILGHKHDGLVREAPADYGIGGDHNYVFSPMLNCPYDCRYCYLRGQHSSANYVLFVNYEDYAAAVADAARAHAGEPVWFFSGFDSDSLAFEETSGFCEFFLPALDAIDNAWLELRTKSSSVDFLLSREPLERVVVAFTFTPQEVAEALELRAPGNRQRLRAMAALAERGWKVGLRFDPLISYPDFLPGYTELIDQIFALLTGDQLHSVTLGTLRYPKAVFERAVRTYPDDPLLAGPLSAVNDIVSYSDTTHAEMIEICRTLLNERIKDDKIFVCR